MTTPDQDALQAWSRVLFEETLFRAATQLRAGDVPPGRTVSVSLPVEVAVDAETNGLVLTLDSVPDGPVTLRLAWPFPELGSR
jgi:hypothetical protein